MDALDLVEARIAELMAQAARAERAEAALDDMTAQRDGALATAGIAEARVEIWRQRAERAEAKLAALQTPCVWAEEEDGAYWSTGCGQANCFEDAGPVQNKYRFCPYCGHPVEVAP